MTLESLLPPPPWVSPPRPAGPQWGHCVPRSRRARPEQLLGLTPAASPTRRGHRWGSGVPPRGPTQGGSTNPPLALPAAGEGQARVGDGFLPSPSPPGRAGPAVPSLPGQRRQLLWGNDGVCPPAPGCERRGRLLPPSKTGPAGRGALLPQPARPHLCGLSGPRSHPAPARPNQLLRVPAARGQAAAGRAPRARQVQEAGAPGALGARWGPGGAGAPGARELWGLKGP